MCPVLILIILEHTLRGMARRESRIATDGLNPYYTGTYSTRPHGGLPNVLSSICLNPYYTGTYSTSVYSSETL